MEMISTASCCTSGAAAAGLYSTALNASTETCHILHIEDGTEYSHPYMQPQLAPAPHVYGTLPARAVDDGDDELQTGDIIEEEEEEAEEEADMRILMNCLRFRMSRLLRACIARARRRSRSTWMMLQLFTTLCQLLAVALLLPQELLLRRHTPAAFASSPLPVWAFGYAVACLAYLLLQLQYLFHRPYITRRDRSPVTDEREVQYSVSPPPFAHHQLIAAPAHARREDDADDNVVAASYTGDHIHEKAGDKVRLDSCLDFFFAVWFVMGVVWVLGKPSTICAQASPTLYGLCVALLLINTFGYMMPLILCCALCCCLQPTTSRVSIQDRNKKNKVNQQQIDSSLPVSTIIKEPIIHAYCFEKIHKKGHESQSTNNTMGCCICLEKYKENAIVRVLPCSHYFHVACVDKWLKLNASCPLCKFSLQSKKASPYLLIPS